MAKKSSRRLESIKNAHRANREDFSTKMEDYLEIILELVESKGYATTLDVSRYMNVSPPSVTKMLKRLDEGGYITYERYRGMMLTEKGTKVATSIRKKHSMLLEFFDMLGIDEKIANKDVEGIEHHLDPKTIERLSRFIEFLKSHRKMVKNFNPDYE